METIPTPLIEKALELTGKKQKDLFEVNTRCYSPNNGYSETYILSIEKFGWYLLSPEFLNTYATKLTEYHGRLYAKFFAEAIYDYQYGSSEPLIQLLSKI